MRRSKSFLGIWESVFNPRFNYGELATIRSQAGLNNADSKPVEFEGFRNQTQQRCADAAADSR